MTPNVATAIDRILISEGGIADVHDGKGITRFGQTPDWLSANGLPVPTTPLEAAENYATWMARTRIDEVCNFNATVGYLVADYAVHSGERVAIEAFQRALGVQADGVIGPVTLRALTLVEPGKLARKVIAQRMRFIGTLLGSSTKDRRIYARGWLNRLAEQVETI